MPKSSALYLLGHCLLYCYIASLKEDYGQVWSFLMFFAESICCCICVSGWLIQQPIAIDVQSSAMIGYSESSYWSVGPTLFFLNPSVAAVHLWCWLADSTANSNGSVRPFFLSVSAFVFLVGWFNSNWCTIHGCHWLPVLGNMRQIFPFITGDNVLKLPWQCATAVIGPGRRKNMFSNNHF